jgi:tetratricopeptide (TPR) repeat protein
MRPPLPPSGRDAPGTRPATPGPDEPFYRQLLQADPGNAGAWQELGLLHNQGRLDEAASCYQQALRLQPSSPDLHLDLGRLLSARGQRPEAVAHYRQALTLRPGWFEALTALGIALAEQGQLDEALPLLQQATRLRPDSAQAHLNLGVALAQHNQPEQALDSLRRALQLQPAYPEAHYNLGAVLGTLRRWDDAIGAYREALRLRPDYGEPYNNLGLALVEARRPEEAVAFLRQAVRLRPQAAEGHNNLGLALAELGRFAAAEACYEAALRLNPKYAEAHANLANAYKEQGRSEEALACYQLALWLDPASASARYNRSLAMLQAGDYRQGWQEYEWRWRRPSMPPRPFRQPRWDGGSLEGRTILLYCEQGMGDTLQFIRYAPLVKARGGTVLVECPGSLLPLLSTCLGIDRLVAEGEPLPDFDVQAPLLSLPGLLGTTLDSVPAPIPYLSADEQRVERRRSVVGDLPGFKVGIAWQGNPRHQWDRHRSFPLACLTPLAAVEGVRLVGLQKGPGSEQVRALAGRFAVLELGEDFDSGGGAFLDTAAVMKHLDLVVTADTAAAHLAGALGVPVWVALSRIADWRWLRGREETPWYPTMRLFRQQELGDWAEVVSRMAAQLRHLVGGRGLGLRVELAPGEVLDKITILEIKSRRLTDPKKLAHVEAELQSLRQAWETTGAASGELAELRACLERVNEALWEVEDELRRCERAKDFGERFVELARSVYRHNDERARLKRRVNELLGAPFQEQKAYPDYG